MGYVMFLICPVTDISALKVYMLEYEMFRIIKIVKKKYTNKLPVAKGPASMKRHVTFL